MAYSSYQRSSSPLHFHSVEYSRNSLHPQSPPPWGNINSPTRDVNTLSSSQNLHELHSFVVVIKTTKSWNRCWQHKRLLSHHLTLSTTREGMKAKIIDRPPPYWMLRTHRVFELWRVILLSLLLWLFLLCSPESGICQSRERSTRVPWRATYVDEHIVSTFPEEVFFRPHHNTVSYCGHDMLLYCYCSYYYY